MLSRLTIFQKGLLLVSVPLLAQLVLLGVLGKLLYDTAWAEHWAMHTKAVIAQAESTFRRLLEAQSGVRGLVLTGDPAFARAYDEAVAQVPRDLDTLDGMVADSAEQRARVGELRGRAGRLLEWLGEQVRLLQSGRRAEAIVRVQDSEGERRLDAVRRVLVEFLAREDRLDEERVATLHRSTAGLGWALAGGTVLALGSTVALGLIFSRGVVGRLAVLRENSRRLAEGKGLTERLAGRDEVAEVDRAFHDMADALARKNQENELFVYSVSHDLRSPLVNLQGFSKELDLACRDLRRLVQGPGVPEAVRREAAVIDDNVAEATRFIQTAVSRLGRIIDALLRLSRAGRVEYRPQEVDVAALVVRVVDALRGTITARKAEVVVGELPPCWGDPTALEQVFANLLGNAVNYLDPSRPGRVEVGSLAAEGTDAQLRTYFVRDNGLGIPRAYLGRVFMAFQRLHDQAAPGEGVGLVLVRRVVERHGGRVWVESAAGQGSTFYVALPAAAARGEAA
jgi:signal transduction histidine kinase